MDAFPVEDLARLDIAVQELNHVYLQCKLAVSVRVPVWLRGDVALQRWLREPADAGFGG